MRKNVSAALFAAWLISSSLFAQQPNPNLITTDRVKLEASSVHIEAPLKRLLNGRLTSAWETNNEREGAQLRVVWNEPQTVTELWIVNKPAPYDLLFDTEARDQIFPAARKIKLEFSDGTSQEAELRFAEFYQIIHLPQPKVTNEIKLVIERVWNNSDRHCTGLGKINAYAENHRPDFKVELFQMYDVHEKEPVQSAKIEMINPDEEIKGARLQIRHNGKTIKTIDLPEIPGRSVTVHQLWIPAVYEQGKLSFTVLRSGKTSFASYETEVSPYEKNYFDGGVFHILSTNHNDLGWLYTPPLTANYRSDELIAPALDLLRDHPEYKYHMESVEYLKEFLVRHPERIEEIALRMREGRFEFGASYTQNLPFHVGQEKLVRHFYYGRRWLLEHFPGCNTRFYSNVDVPGMSSQFPQILKKSGVDYIVQGRFPWGFYYWEGLDGTTIPMFALRYTGSSRLLNPVNNTGWLKFQNVRDPYYRERNLPNESIYDFNMDYLPPAPQMISFVKEQNEAMKEFAGIWNKHFEKEPLKQIKPATMRFTAPDEILDHFFGNGELEVETIKGSWPLSWAYYDEPGHREGLLIGRKGHHLLLQSEKMYAWLKTMYPKTNYPQNRLDDGWMANTWPDHGWGGNMGPSTDSLNVVSYQKSFDIGSALAGEAGSLLAGMLPKGDHTKVPFLVYNPSGRKRTDIVTGMIKYPRDWQGLEVIDASGMAIPYELIGRDKEQGRVEVMFEAEGIPSLGYKTYYARKAAAFTGGPVPMVADSLENNYLKIRFGKAGIASIYDKTGKREVLRTDKFEGGEVIQLTAPSDAWNTMQETTTEDFDRSMLHEFKTIRAVETPIRYIVEKEAEFRHFTLRERFILNKNARELIVEADILNWKGTPSRELRIVFPINVDRSARVSYEEPFGTAETGKDEIDYSILPETVECNFSGQLYGRVDLPFREAVNWVDISTGQYQGSGCLSASDITLHHFRDETDHPVDYPLIQHVLLSTRKSLSWNPENWFVQPGNHSYRMALYPHDGNWRYAYKKGQDFNMPLALYMSENANSTEQPLPESQSFLEIGPENLIVSAVKQAEDGNGIIIRFYEAEGRYSKLFLKGFKPIKQAHLTNMIEYDEKELSVSTNGTLELPIKPWEIVTLRLKY